MLYTIKSNYYLLLILCILHKIIHCTHQHVYKYRMARKLGKGLEKFGEWLDLAKGNM